MFAWLKRMLVPAPRDVTALSSAELMAICDKFWLPGSGDHGEYVRAYNELHRRGPEIRDWCRGLLVHPDYWAREAGADLLGELGRRRQLGDAEAAVVAELGALTQRPVEEDSKEVQAIDAAIRALAAIGNPAGIPYLRGVLFSDAPFLEGDTQWDAAEALGQLVGQPFTEAPDRVQAARDWLIAYPEAGGAEAGER